MSIEGKTIVFTGKISMTRIEAQDLVRKHRGIPGSDVSRNTDLLVVGEKPGSKLARAIVYGIKTISEEEFLSLLTPIEEKEELSEIQSHIITLTCAYCQREYKQWDTLPNYETCPICEILSHPECPHCKDEPIYVEDYNLYHCTLCGTWFKAPYSIHTRKTKHLCFFKVTKETPEGVHKSCLACNNAIFLSNYDIQYGKELYEKAPTLVAEWKKQRTERKRMPKQEEEALRFFKSLSPNELEQLGRQLYVR